MESTIMCIAHERLPFVTPCTVPGEHRVTCHDHAGWSVNPGACRGCLPRLAVHGFLCRGHYEKVVDALAFWPRFEVALIGVDTAVTVETAGRSGSSLGYVPFTGTYLAVNECLGFLASMPDGPRGLDMWVSTEAGARDAIQFAYAADRAYRTHQIEEPESTLRRVRCPRCEHLSLVRRPPQFQHEPVEVECQNAACGRRFVEGRHQAVAYRATADGWEAVAVDAVAVIERIERKERA